ncbi:TrmH family RNA methyltransferase [Candidatus Microgenomates bacterium]|nr:TrmH family RNA methyltransferase [Candidatus Microgenomates bacterium]
MKNRSRQLVLILDNIRSAHNVGAIFRSADAFAVAEIISTGITPYPEIKNDTRLPHVRQKATRLIAKTALGAEKTIPFRHIPSIKHAIAYLIDSGYKIYGLEQSPKSVDIRKFKPHFPCALSVGNELTGLSRSHLDACDAVVEIPILGKKESLNVAVATGIALFQLTG